MKRGIIILLAVLFLVPMLVTESQAMRKYLKDVNNTCSTNYDCTLCHVSNQGGGERTATGDAFLAAGHDPCVVCPGAPDCSCTPEAEIPCDGIDQDCDGVDLVDCGDSRCDSDPSCGCQPQTEIPCNGIDEDCDGSDLVDCGDSACSGDPSCPTGACSDITDKAVCQADPACEWVGKGKNAKCQDIITGRDLVVMATNDLGMHCACPSANLFLLLPPFNTLRAQVIERDVNDVRGGTPLVVADKVQSKGSQSKGSHSPQSKGSSLLLTFGAS